MLGQRQLGLALDLPHGHLRGREEQVQLVFELLAAHFGPAAHVLGVGDGRQVQLLEQEFHHVESVSAELDEEHLLVEVLDLEADVRVGPLHALELLGLHQGQLCLARRDGHHARLGLVHLGPVVRRAVDHELGHGRLRLWRVH